jgi:hypothetical protein
MIIIPLGLTRLEHSNIKTLQASFLIPSLAGSRTKNVAQKFPKKQL